ncbi:hypothetical protein BDW22DRAFT_1353994 [Trametopsis cervina]|nr:hypothetical protein BDW22DRAFT_1353994 [Trametopsis cervina]
MPVSARKSSVGAARRGPQKYIRYRADDLQLGKRTGIAVGYVDRDSDEFEPFEKVIGQADLRTPPKPHMPSRKKKGPKTPLIDFDDEDGEMSMELDESNPNSPAAYLTSGMHRITSSVQRTGSSSRPVQRRTDIDFDRVPSPRRDSFAPALSSRRSYARSPGPSHLSRLSVQQRGDESEPEPMNYSPPPEDYDDQPPASPEGDFDEERTPQQSHRQSLSRSTFLQLSRQQDQEDEEMQEDDDEVERYMSAKSQAKGKGRQAVDEQDEDMEPEIAQGMEEVENMADEQLDDQEGESEQRDANEAIDKMPSKKPRKATNDENAASKRPRGRPRKQDGVLREVIHDQNIDDDGLRRGKRMRYKPLEWWRCEKVVYGRRESGVSLVPTIKEIRRVPKEEIQPLGAKHKRKRPPRSKSQSTTLGPDMGDAFNPEEGWDDETNPMGIVLEYPTNEEVTKRVAFTAKMVNPKLAANAQFSFQKIFGDGNFMAAGQLIIPPGGTKPTKGTKDNTFIFYVIEGAVTFKVHRTSFVLATGGMFLVPRGNMYYIQNISDRDAKLFFAQARESEADRGRSLSESRTPVPREAAKDGDLEDLKLPMKSTKKRA